MPRSRCIPTTDLTFFLVGVALAHDASISSRPSPNRPSAILASTCSILDNRPRSPASSTTTFPSLRQSRPGRLMRARRRLHCWSKKTSSRELLLKKGMAQHAASKPRDPKLRSEMTGRQRVRDRSATRMWACLSLTSTCHSSV